MKREKVSILFGTQPDYNVLALKYFILTINKIQSYYEFVFPDIQNYFLDDKENDGEIIINNFMNAPLKQSINADYYIILTISHLNRNYFSVSLENISIITSFGWEKYFSPPSLFEYLLHSIIACLLCMNDKLNFDYHSETRGCLLDYTRLKSEDRVDIAMGYICDEDKEFIIRNTSEEYLKEILKIIDRSWIGSIAQLHSVAYNLKHYFKFDIEKDSGLNKTCYEKIKDSLYDIPKELILIIFGTIITVLLVILGFKN